MPNNKSFVPPILPPPARSGNDYSASAPLIGVTANAAGGVDIAVASGGPTDVVMPADGNLMVYAATPSAPMMLPNGEETEQYCIVIEPMKKIRLKTAFPAGIPYSQYWILEGLDQTTVDTLLSAMASSVSTAELTKCAAARGGTADAANWLAKVQAGDWRATLSVEDVIGQIALDTGGAGVLRFRVIGPDPDYVEQDAAALLAVMATHVDAEALADHPVCVGAAAVVQPTAIYLRVRYYNVATKTVEDLVGATVDLVDSDTSTPIESTTSDSGGIASFPTPAVSGVSFHFEITPASAIAVGDKDENTRDDTWSTLGWKGRIGGEDSPAWMVDCLGFQVGSVDAPLEIFYGVPFNLRVSLTAIQYSSSGLPVLSTSGYSMVKNRAGKGTEVLMGIYVGTGVYSEVATFRLDENGEAHGILFDLDAGAQVEPCFTRRLSDPEIGVDSFRQVQAGTYASLAPISVLELDGNAYWGDPWEGQRFWAEDHEIAVSDEDDFETNAMLVILKYLREAQQWWGTLLGSYSQLLTDHMFFIYESTSGSAASTHIQDGVTCTWYHQNATYDWKSILTRGNTAHEHAHATMMQVMGMTDALRNWDAYVAMTASPDYSRSHYYTRFTSRLTTFLEFYGLLVELAWGLQIPWNNTGSGAYPKDRYTTEQGALLSSVDAYCVEGALATAVWEWLQNQGLEVVSDANTPDANMNLADISTHPTLQLEAVRVAFLAVVWQPTVDLGDPSTWIAVETWPEVGDLVYEMEIHLGATFAADFQPNHLVPWNL